MEYYGIEGHSDLVRDPETNSIININSFEYEKYLSRKKVKNKEDQKVQNIEEKVASMKNDIDEIKSILKELLNGSK